MQKYEKMGIKNFEEKMNQFVWQGYHYTKIYDIKNITKKGIVALSEKSLRIIKNNIKEKYKNECDYIEKEFKKYENEKFEKNNAKYISFCTNENQSSNQMKDILRYYGGEKIGDYFKENTRILSKLLKMGTPIIVKFNFKYDSLSKESKKNIKNVLEGIEKSSENKIQEKKSILDRVELRIENIINTEAIQGYYILDKDNLEIKKYIKIH